MLAEQSGVAAVMADRRNTYRLWQVVAVAWSKGAVLTAVELKDTDADFAGQCEGRNGRARCRGRCAGIRGREVLGAGSPVNADREEFTVTLTMQPEAGRG